MITHKGTVTLETPRLILRKFKIEDSKSAFKNCAADKLVSKYPNWDSVTSHEEMKAFIEKLMLSYDETTYYWAIEFKQSKEIVGSIGITEKPADDKLTNIYYCIGRDYWGHGIAAEALNKMLLFFFDEVGYERVETMHPANEVAPGRVMEKAGMHFCEEVEHEGKLLKNYYINRNMYNGVNIPLFFQPIFVDHIWGGQKIHHKYGFNTNSQRIAEYWAVSAVSGSESIIKNGKYKGMTLNQLFLTNKEMFGNIEGDCFPLLVKIIDAAKDLSVQVHPSDEYANSYENGKLGKNECWYILEGDNQEIVYGHTANNREEFQEKIDNNEWSSLLNTRKVFPGDFVMVESGKVHAIKGGIMLLEIQQTSDVTYRLYDYDRVDDKGQKRELHIDKALDVIEYPDREYDFEPVYEEINGALVTTLVSNKYFTVRKFKVNKHFESTNEFPFMIICITEGNGRFNGFFVKVGSIFLVPSNVDLISIEGDLEFIEAHV